MSDKTVFSLTKFIAFLVHPYLNLPSEMSRPQLNTEEMSKIFGLSKSNKILLRLVNYDDSSRFPVKSNIIAKLVNTSSMFRKSRNYALKLKKELLDVVAKFNQQGIDTVFIKSLNTLPLDSDNFDILVKEKDLAASFNVLKNSGFVELPWVREPYKWLFRNVKEGKDYLAVHLHTAVAWEGIKFVDVNDLWKRYQKVEIDGVAVGTASPEHHLLITMAHAFFENHRFSLNDLACLIEDIYPNEVDWNYITSWVTKDCWFASFYGMLLLADNVYRDLFGNTLVPKVAYKKLRDRREKNSSNLSQKLINHLNRKKSLPVTIPIITVPSHYIRKIVANPHISLLKKMEKILSLSKDFLERRMPIRRNLPALTVCFVGQDGSGKTTHARYIWKELKKRGFRVKFVWSRGTGLFFGPLLNLARSALLKGEISNEHKNEYEDKHATLLKSEPVRSVWAYILLADHLAQLFKVKLALASGRIAICDRYIFDTLVDIKCDLGKNLNKAFEKTVERLAPKPRIIFMMDTQPRELVKRRPSIKLDLAENKRSVYLDYLRTKEAFSIIDTSDDLQKNRQKTLSITLQTFYGHY